MMTKPYAIVAEDFLLTGGMDRPNYELAWHLAERRGAEVHLVGYRVARPLADHPNVVWHRVPRPFGRPTFGSPFLDRIGRRVAKEVSRSGGTVVVNGGNCLWNDVNWIHYVHNVDVMKGGQPPFLRHRWMRWKRRRDQRRERQAVSQARLIITDSNLAKDCLVAGSLIDSQQVRTIYYGIDPARFRPSTDTERIDARRSLGLPLDRPLVAFIGGLGYDRRKGFDVLFDAWCRCRQHAGWDAQLVVAGNGPELPYWRRRVAESGWEGDIYMLGYTKAVSTLLAAADALVSPTRFEPYGHGVHEAICCGLPVFVTRCAGIAERFPVDLKDLLLDDPPDALQLCSRLKDWHKDLDGYRCRILPFSEELRRRTWSDMAAEFVQAMTEAQPVANQPGRRVTT
jgi:glycosyltransferase involved in cell wall biosynthesis